MSFEYLNSIQSERTKSLLAFFVSVEAGFKPAQIDISGKKHVFTIKFPLMY